MSTILPSWVLLWITLGWQPPLEPLGRLDGRLIPEASGIVKSRRYPGIYWVHNDSGNPPLIFAIRGDGRIVRQFRLEVPNIDWEDIAIDDRGHLYLGDIGDNAGVLPVHAIYRIDEPDPGSPAGEPLKASAISFYSLPRSSRFDAESLVYDEGNGILVAKYLDGREAELFSVPLDPPSPLTRPARPRLIGRLPGFIEPATGADMSQDRTLLAVCSSTVTRIYRRGHAQSPPWRLLGEVKYESLPIEGIGWDGRDLVLVAEGGGFYRVSEKTWRARSPRESSIRRPLRASPASGPE
ncbi:MAG: hypothetical protein ACHRXM_23285 [Isosphaerales bacterium]